MAESQTENARLSQRATWERNTRRAKAKKLSYSLPGWQCGESIWDINTLVDVSDPLVGIQDTLLVAAVELTLDDHGTRSTVELVSPATYSIFELGAEKPKKNKMSGF